MTLTEYLHLSTYSNVDEGLGDWMKKIFSGNKKSVSSKEEKSVKTALGLFGGFFSKLKSNSSGSNDPITKAMETIEKESLANAKRREEAFMSAKENAYASKLLAKHEHKQNQLELSNRKKVDAFKAKQAHMERERNYWKNNTMSFTKEENEAYDKKIEEAFKDLAGYNIPDLEKMKQIQSELAYDDDGNPRDLKSILEYCKNGKGKELLEEYNKYAKKYQKEIASSMSDEQFKEVMKDVQVSADSFANAKDDITRAEELQGQFEENTKAVGFIKELKKNHENAKTALAQAEEKLNNLQGEVGNKDELLYNVVKNDDGTIEAKELTHEELENKFNSLVSDDSDIFKKSDSDENREVDKNKLKQSLKQKGIPESHINNIIKELDKNPEKLSVDLINKTAGEYAKNNAEELNKDTLKNIKQNIAQANIELKKAKETAEKNPDPTESGVLDKILEEHPEYENTINTYKNIPELELEAGTYDLESEEGKKNQKEISDGVNKAKKTLSDLEAENTARLKLRQQRINDRTEQSSIPAGTQDKIADKMQGLDKGEIFGKDVNGKLVPGFKIGDKFYEKPHIGASEEEIKEYNKKKSDYMLSANMKNLDKEIENMPKPTYDKESKTWKLDGKEISEDDAIEHLSNRQAAVENREHIRDHKVNHAKNLNKILKKDSNGKTVLNKEEYDKLSDDDKETLKLLLKDRESLKDLDSGNSFIKDLKNLSDDEWEETMDYLDSEEDVDEPDDNDEGDEDKDNGDGDNGDDKEAKKDKNNPANVWKKRKKKNGKGTTKNYYNKEGSSINPEEYKTLVDNYKESKSKESESKESESSPKESLKSNLIFKLNEHIINPLNDYLLL